MTKSEVTVSQTIKLVLFSLVTVFSGFFLTAAGEDPRPRPREDQSNTTTNPESDDEDLLNPNDFHPVTIITRGPGPENIFTFGVKTLDPGCTCLLEMGRTDFALKNGIRPHSLKVIQSTFVFTSTSGREISVVYTPENINAQLQQFKERNMLPVRIKINLVRAEVAPEPTSSCVLQ